MPTEEQRPLFSVVIPTYQRNDLLERCLRCLAPGAQLGMVLSAKAASSSRGPVVAGDAQFQISETHLSTSPTYEVIVADDGRASTAEAMIRKQFPWAHWVQGPGTGPAGNRNAGASLARGQWLAFTDDDCLPQPGWLAAMMDAMGEHPACDVLEGEISADRPRKTLAEHAPVGGGGGNLWSCNFAIRRKVFIELHGFDDSFRVCMEDSDFALRLRKTGRVYPYVPKAMVLHPWRPRQLIRDGWKDHTLEIADHLRYNRKHSVRNDVAAINLMRLAANTFRNDLRFVVRQRDVAGIPHAIAQFLRFSKIALQYFFS